MRETCIDNNCCQRVLSGTLSWLWYQKFTIIWAFDGLASRNQLIRVDLLDKISLQIDSVQSKQHPHHITKLKARDILLNQLCWRQGLMILQQFLHCKYRDYYDFIFIYYFMPLAQFCLIYLIVNPLSESDFPLPCFVVNLNHKACCNVMWKDC